MSGSIASGVAKQLRFRQETTLNVPPGATGAQLLRRVTSEFSLEKQTYQSGEIRPDYQIADFRHGSRTVQGTIRGELSCLTYAEFFEAALRSTWAAGATTGALTNVTASASAPHFVRAAGSFLTDGFKIGDVVRFAGWTAPATANNARNYRITALTATQMTVADLNGTTATVTAKAAGDSVTCAVPGRKLIVPLSGHANDSFYIEEWHPDILQSERFGGCRVSRLGLSLPASGMATIDVGFLGIDQSNATAAYYTSPTAATLTGILAAVNGRLRLGGTDIATVTSLSLTVDGGHTSEAVVGSNVSPDVFPGRVQVSGSFSAFFQDGVLRDNFINEDEISLIAHLTATNANNSPVMGITMPRIKLGGARKTDGERGLMREFSFQALLNTTGGAGTSADQTTIAIQDTEVP